MPVIFFILCQDCNILPCFCRIFHIICYALPYSVLPAKRPLCCALDLSYFLSYKHWLFIICELRSIMSRLILTALLPYPFQWRNTYTIFLYESTPYTVMLARYEVLFVNQINKRLKFYMSLLNKYFYIKEFVEIINQTS